jgi:dienelactone hydrolase
LHELGCGSKHGSEARTLKPRRTSIATSVPSAGHLRFEISPNPAFVDEPVRIFARGLRPFELVVIRAATEDDENCRWRSHAEFRADESGCVDVSTMEPRAGSYCGLSPMGLFWSMRLEDTHAHGRTVFAKIGAAPNRVSLEMEIGGRIAASAQLDRNFLAPGTEVRDLNIGDESRDTRSQGGGQSGGHVGRLFLPSGRGPHPVVIVLSGTGGGFDLDKAAVLSHHGFATLALAYFGIPPLPAWLHRIPLDYFEAALAWLSAQPEVDSQRVGVLGISRGAELALLLGTKFPQIRSIVAFAPSSVAWAAGGRDKATGEIIPTWTWRGEPVPFAPLPLRGFMLRSAFPVAVARRPVMFRNLFRAGLRNREAIARAAIPVEQIRGPLLLVSGGDDHLWPAAKMCEAILGRLTDHGFRHAVEYLNYPRAGHMLRYPYLPTTSRQSRNQHLRNARFSFGGTPTADAEANDDSWGRAIAFLRSSLR